MIKIDKAYSFSEIGKKDNQEDFVYPAPASVKPDQKYFILCDGMGGHDNGEVASSTVATALGSYFDLNPVDMADKAYFEQALASAYGVLDGMDNGAEKKMGTTMTCLLFNEGSFLAAHIGDSRIYQVRDGKIIFKTRDHSLVNDLLKAGEITEEEAKNFPHKNVITRAMQPNSRRCKADVYESQDVLPGDYFFMCCDGVLERVSDELLCDILSRHESDEEKFNAIKAECDKGTRDNYTCWLIGVTESSTKGSAGKSEEEKHDKGNKTLLPYVLVAVVSLFLGFMGGSFVFSGSGNDDAEVKKLEEQVDHLKCERDSIKTYSDSLKIVLDSVEVCKDSLEMKLEKEKSLVIPDNSEK